MKEKSANGIHWSFWVIGAIALIWNVLGVVNYFVQMDPEVIAAYRASEQAIIVGRPAWATGAFAIAVFGGAIGSLLLLLRKSAAIYVLIASLIGVVGTMIHALGVDVEFGPGEIAGIIAMPLGVAAFLIWYAKHAQSKGWIR
jgi:hypothetical protein